MFVSSVSVEQELISDAERNRWLFTMPCVAAIARDGLELNCPVTFLVGENGSGKSTLVEAIAEAFGLDARGGRAGRKYGNNREKTPLGTVLRLGLTRDGARMKSGARSRQKGYSFGRRPRPGSLRWSAGCPVTGRRTWTSAATGKVSW